MSGHLYALVALLLDNEPLVSIR